MVVAGIVDSASFSSKFVGELYLNENSMDGRGSDGGGIAGAVGCETAAAAADGTAATGKIGFGLLSIISMLIMTAGCLDFSMALGDLRPNNDAEYFEVNDVGARTVGGVGADGCGGSCGGGGGASDRPDTSSLASGDDRSLDSGIGTQIRGAVVIGVLAMGTNSCCVSDDNDSSSMINRCSESVLSDESSDNVAKSTVR